MDKNLIAQAEELILEIKELDGLIMTHKKEDDNDFMVSQFETRKRKFLNELIDKLNHENISSQEFSHFIKLLIDKYFTYPENKNAKNANINQDTAFKKLEALL